jgi:fructose-1,6-bisphosphatase/inositol monophosphatase family enzyme
VHSFPFTCVSIALVVGAVTVLGVVYDPSKDEIFYAVKGKGAFLNGKAIRVSEAKSLSEAIVVRPSQISVLAFSHLL